MAHFTTLSLDFRAFWCVWVTYLSFFLQSQSLSFRKNCGCQRLPKLMEVKGEFWCIMRTECLHRDQFRQHVSGLETWD